VALVKAYGICVYKVEKNSTKILLCKSVQSLNRWGFLKGVQDSGETSVDTAMREFNEESSIWVESDMLEEFVFQKNEDKDIGIYLVNANKIQDLEDYFIGDTLLDNFLSWENSKVKFFDINELPLIKKKQNKIAKKIVSLLTPN
jgi:ADP-ribose pyrophosphatase YjhB (NUDIX family)